MPNENAKRPIPGSYSEMFPGRFLKADMFKGKKITLTIKAIFGEDLLSAEDEKKPEWIVQFIERPFEWVMNKSNAYCLYRMFGGDPHSWVGHKVTLFPQPGTWFGEKGEAIRVWGSPDIPEDIPITLRFLRKKRDREMVMHKVEAKANGTAPAPAAVPDHGPYHELFGYLGWTTAEQAAYLGRMGNRAEAEITADLKRQLNERDA